MNEKEQAAWNVCDDIARTLAEASRACAEDNGSVCELEAQA